MKVLKSYGTQGAVVISCGASDPEVIDEGRPVFIEFDGLPVPFFIESIEPKGGRFIVKFEDIDSYDEAESLVGKTAIYSSDEDETEDEPFVGMTVYDHNGRRIGPVTSFADYNGNTCIDVEYNGREVTLPINEELIITVSEDKLYLTVPEGLL